MYFYRTSNIFKKFLDFKQAKIENSEDNSTPEETLMCKIKKIRNILDCHSSTNEDSANSSHIDSSLSRGELQKFVAGLDALKSQSLNLMNKSNVPHHHIPEASV